MSENKPNPRRLAQRTLLRMESEQNGGDGAYSSRLIDAATRQSGIDGSDRALFCRLVTGVTERRITLDYIIEALSGRSVKKLDAEPLTLCRLGIYQLRYLERIPEFAAVNETVRLAGKYCRGFVNAILREYQRKPDIPLPDRKKDLPLHLSVAYSAPVELCMRYISLFGETVAEAILASYLDEPMLTLRVNTLVTTREDLMARLISEGFEVEPTEHSPYGLRAKGRGLPSVIDDGLAFVQDESSQLCALALSPCEGDAILDCCACPGGKSFSAALLSADRASILSCDLHDSKLPLITSGARRLGIKSITTLCRDATEPFSHDEVYDKIICDVPCSGLGVAAKKTEIKYRPLSGLSALPSLQYDILCNVCAHLRAGGVLVYSTCTILPEENGEVVRRFLREHPCFDAVDFTLGTLSSDEGMLTILPSQKRDGFFIAKLRKAQ